MEDLSNISDSARYQRFKKLKQLKDRMEKDNVHAVDHFGCTDTYRNPYCPKCFHKYKGW